MSNLTTSISPGRYRTVRGHIRTRIVATTAIDDRHDHALARRAAPSFRTHVHDPPEAAALPPPASST